jgi:CRISPR system Cascade subunit CasE
MKLYLSRISLNPLFSEALQLAASPTKIHERLAPVFGGNHPQTQNRVLFRVDEGPVVLVQSELLPDWDLFERKPRLLRSDPETKEMELNLAVEQRMGFRLLARPSARPSGDFGHKENGKRKPGPRRTCRTDEERINWLSRKGRDSGFMVETVGLTNVVLDSIKWRGAPREKGSTFAAVQFDGVLVVTDPDKLKEAVRNGIGPQKAYGFGLLSLARCE